jgi:signal transduction histidine kinase
VITVKNLPELYINPNLIRPLFYNLIHNALKFSKPNVIPEINIYSDITSASPEEDGRDGSGKYYRIYVEDNGIGFEQKYADQVFEMFKRLHHQDDLKEQGIGLAFCKKIVEQHEGYIAVRSTLGKGSTFIISLPMQPVRSILPWYPQPARKKIILEKS